MRKVLNLWNLEMKFYPKVQKPQQKELFSISMANSGWKFHLGLEARIRLAAARCPRGTSSVRCAFGGVSGDGEWDGSAHAGRLRP
jgi:hypothetical protein